jgi:hypothetical protein
MPSTTAYNFGDVVLVPLPYLRLQAIWYHLKRLSG